jgi:uncharacterized membrane protein YgdD (TMEM256/DUF423 family)
LSDLPDTSEPARGHPGARALVAAGALAALVGVALGAFGAHGLRTRVAPGLLQVWETAVLYQLVHALGLVLVGALWLALPRARLLRWSGWVMAGGTVLFSGSLYGLVLTEVRWLGAITPFGGGAFLLGWALLALAVLSPSAPDPGAAPTGQSPPAPG